MTDSYLSITDLNSLLNTTLEEGVGQVGFAGEIHQISRPQSGHLYFDLKDESSRAAAVVWRGVASRLGFDPEPGMEVICHGRPNVYERSGKLQMIVFKMEPAGEGLLQKKFLALKAALEKEGLFQKDRKRALPFLPAAVGIVTSGSGAAIHDIVVKLNERMPSVKKYLADVRVQGEGAATEIATAIEAFNAHGGVDVLIVGRGGGSLEDLWAFNEEVVVRAVFASRIPVISGVGHEVDVSLSDLAADARAPTPTAAAEMVVPHRDELMKALMEHYRRLSDVDRWLQPLTQALDDVALGLEHATLQILQGAKADLQRAELRLQQIEPEQRIASLGGQLRDLGNRLSAVLALRLSRQKQSLSLIAGRLTGVAERRRLVSLQQRAAHLESRLLIGMEKQFEGQQKRLTAYGKLLESLSPFRVLDRGYAIVKSGESVIRSSETVSAGDPVCVSLADGGFDATVQSVTRGMGSKEK